MIIKQLVSSVILLACILLPAIPAVASDSGSTTVSGTMPLLIFDVQASGITCSEATVSWRTNGASSSQVFYDTLSHDNTADYAFNSFPDNTPVVLHSVLLNGLSPSTTYHYRVKSVATIGGDKFSAVSPDFTFKTALPLCVMTLCVLPVGTNCTVLWGYLGDNDGTTPIEVYFQYGTTNAYGAETSHEIITCTPRFFMAKVSNLLPDTTYHFRAVAVGDYTSYGDDKVFRTLPQPAITVVIPDGGECWRAGTRQTIKWTYTTVSGDVKIELLKGGLLYRVISYSAPKGHNGSGSYSWLIPSSQTADTDYRIRVTSIISPDCSDTSNNNFTIKK